MNTWHATAVAALILFPTLAAAQTADPAGPGPAPVSADGSGSAAANPARDRESILAMQGEYMVGFNFDETVTLQPGYERHPAMRSGGDEAVIVADADIDAVFAEWAEPAPATDPAGLVGAPGPRPR